MELPKVASIIHYIWDKLISTMILMTDDGFMCFAFQIRRAF